MEKDRTKKYSPLWDDFLSGSEDAFSQIYIENVQILFIYGLRFCQERELVQDCIQEVFVLLHRDRSKLERTDNIKYYLFRMLKNALLNAFRKDKVHNKYLDHLVETDFVDATSPNAMEEKELELKNKEQVAYILSLLTDRQREVIYLRYIEGLTIEDICEKMDMKYQSVVNLIHRGILRIKELIDGDLSAE